MGYSKKNKTTIVLVTFLFLVLCIFNFLCFKTDMLTKQADVNSVLLVKTILLTTLIIFVIFLIVLIIMNVTAKKKRKSDDKIADLTKSLKENNYTLNSLKDKFLNPVIDSEALNNVIMVKGIDLISCNNKSVSIRVRAQYLTSASSIGEKVIINNQVYDVVERGIIVNKKGNGLLSSDCMVISNKDNLSNNWSIDNNKLTYSYVLNNLSEDYSIIAYLIVIYNNERTVFYSSCINTDFY